MGFVPIAPFDPAAQRLTAREWEHALAGPLDPRDVRPLVAHSWARAREGHVAPALDRAPLALDADAVAVARERVDWLPFALRAVSQLHGSFGNGHVLTMFDADGCMLHAQGDGDALAGLAEINFRPGARWSERAVGTNGPGTALALGHPVHIVGAEHWCARWQEWHCAAVPLRDQVTGALLGALDVSGRREHAHPHTLDLVVAIGLAVEQMLAARDVERRYLVVHRLLELAGRWPGEALVAVDRAGRLLFASGPVPDAIREAGTLPAPVRRAVAHALRGATDAAPRDLTVPLDDGPGAELVALPALCHPVLDGLTAVGACVLLRGHPAPNATRHALAADDPMGRRDVRDAGGRLVGTTGGEQRDAGRATPARGTPGVVATRAAADGAASTTRYSFYDLVGDSPALAEACRIAAAAAGNALPVLLTGESGTGKEVFAQSIHRASARRDAPFVAVNCAALPRELLEAELFGYVGGAFSGARREGSPGKFVAAHGGTLFLDEIGELPPAAQAALLRVLQEGEVTALGALRGRPVDVRVVAATNRDIRGALAEGRLREDLYYRLDVLRIHLPPLRERRGDVAPLARRFLAAAGADLGRPGHAFTPDALALLERYPWPGNVRELKNVVRRLVALCPSPLITRHDLPTELVDAAEAASVAAPQPSSPRTLATPPAMPALASPSTGDASDWGDGGHAALASGEDPTNLAALERARTLAAVRAAPTMGDAARRLGITRSTLYRRLARYGVHTGRTVVEDDSRPERGPPTH